MNNKVFYVTMSVVGSKKVTEEFMKKLVFKDSKLSSFGWYYEEFQESLGNRPHNIEDLLIGDNLPTYLDKGNINSVRIDSVSIPQSLLGREVCWKVELNVTSISSMGTIKEWRDIIMDFPKLRLIFEWKVKSYGEFEMKLQDITIHHKVLKNGESKIVVR